MLNSKSNCLVIKLWVWFLELFACTEDNSEKFALCEVFQCCYLYIKDGQLLSIVVKVCNPLGMYVWVPYLICSFPVSIRTKCTQALTLKSTILANMSRLIERSAFLGKHYGRMCKYHCSATWCVYLHKLTCNIKTTCASTLTKHLSKPQ